MKFFQIASLFIALLFASGHAAGNRRGATRMFPQEKQVSHVTARKMLGTKSHAEVSSQSSSSKITANKGKKKSGTESTNKKVSVHPKKSHKTQNQSTKTTTTTTRYITKMVPKVITKPAPKPEPKAKTKRWSKVITRYWAKVISKPKPEPPTELIPSLIPSPKPDRGPEPTPAPTLKPTPEPTLKPTPEPKPDTIYWPYREPRGDLVDYPGHNHRLGGIYEKEARMGPLYSHKTHIGSLMSTHPTFFASPRPHLIPDFRKPHHRAPKTQAALHKELEGAQPLKKTVLELLKTKAGLKHESTIISQDLLLLKAVAIHQKEIAHDRL